MSHKIISVLLTGVGTQTCGNVVSALRKSSDYEFRFIGCDASDQAYGLYLVDKGYLIPKANEDNFIDSVLQICEKESVDILIPLLSLEIPKFAEAAPRFHAKGIKLIVSSQETVTFCNDKLLTNRIFISNGIPCPALYEVKDIDQKGRISFPLVIKKRVSSGSKGVHVVNSDEELKKIVSNINLKEIIIQEYLDGKEFTVDVLANQASELIAAVPRKRTKIHDGKSVNGETFYNKDLLTMTSEIVKELDIVGPANIQGFIDNKGGIKFHEINTRFSAGGLPLCVESGPNTPLLLVQMALGIDVKPQLEYKVGVKMYRYLTEIFHKPGIRSL